MRILFWGTPEFAAAPLRALLGEGFDVVGVVTRADKPQGRSRTVRYSATKVIALEEGLPVFQPANARDPELLQMLKVMQPDISIVVAYGHILPAGVIDLPTRGTLNIHASLLPLLRGAAPIQAAIRQGFTTTGVSIMRMVPALDAGPVILQATTPIHQDDTYGELTGRLSELGALTLMESLALLELDRSVETPQDESKATYAAKVGREATRIDWTAAATEVSRAVRAYDPKPGAYSASSSGDVKLFGPSVLEHRGGAPGEILPPDSDHALVVACGSGALSVREVQPAGKSRMPAADWMRGRGAVPGQNLTV